ncbi:hypothetical protein CAEBREN_11722 [Caenorhabditis brenneri]|uniref:Galactosylgalactosylxylosylprotein 3-beta-glucuronosyltransferase n=1 Tax=Caenorhabditis brenneri TaxID=135651 RepID=G0N3Q2_CAEBE|nr:hypothetical protein CAEBREN_11722 [Caenorhabditis brenneri]
MIPSRLLEKWWLRAFIALVVFFIWQICYAINRVQGLEEEKTVLQATIEVLKRKSDVLRTEIHEKERALTRLDGRIEEIDTQIRDHISLLPRVNRSTPYIYFITPTHFRAAQKADLTRLSYTLSHVPNLHWIVVEDSDKLTSSVAEILKSSRLPYTHLNAQTPKDQKMKYTDPNWTLPRGVEQRNSALLWIRNQLAGVRSGVVYFGDDDNTYDLKVFGEMRKVQKAGVWPVGIVGGMFVETPILAKNGSIIDFNAVWKRERPFPIDMAAFAVNITLILQNPNAMFSFDVPRGYQESTFLEKVGIHRYNMEPLAEKCSKVYVWHTRTEKSKLSKDLIEKLTKKTGFNQLEADALGVEF